MVNALAYTARLLLELFRLQNSPTTKQAQSHGNEEFSKFSLSTYHPKKCRHRVEVPVNERFPPRDRQINIRASMSPTTPHNGIPSSIETSPHTSELLSKWRTESTSCAANNENDTSLDDRSDQGPTTPRQFYEREAEHYSPTWTLSIASQVVEVEVRRWKTRCPPACPCGPVHAIFHRILQHSPETMEHIHSENNQHDVPTPDEPIAGLVTGLSKDIRKTSFGLSTTLHRNLCDCSHEFNRQVRDQAMELGSRLPLEMDLMFWDHVESIASSYTEMIALALNRPRGGVAEG